MRPERLVLAYHAVSPTWPSPLAVRPEDLRRQVAALLARGYRAATLHEAVHGDAPGRALVVTFDDAYASLFDHALPVLTALGVPATVFAPTDHVGSGGPMGWPGIAQWLGGAHEDELHALGWEQLGALADAGWEIGSHTCSHPWLTTLDDAALARELTHSRARIETRLGRPCRSLAYPFGDHDARVAQAARAAGYRTAVTVPDELRAEDPLREPRVGIYRSDTERSFGLKTSPLVRLLRRSPLGRPATQLGRRGLAGIRR